MPISYFGLPLPDSTVIPPTLPTEYAWTARRLGSRGTGRLTGGEALMQGLLRPILNDDALTRHLGDAEARILVEWLVERAERLDASPNAAERVAALCRRARAIGLFVGLWCYRGEHGAAGQLASAERFS